MRKFLSAIAAGFTSLVLAALLVFAPASSASAGPPCNLWSWFCGAVSNVYYSEGWVVVAEDWPRLNNKTRLNPGQKSDPAKDIDGIYVRSGCTGWDGAINYSGGRWIQTHDAPGYKSLTVTC